MALLGIAAVAGVVLVAGCGGSGGSSTSASNPTSPQAAQTVQVKVVGHEEGKKGPDGQGHDTFLPADFKVKAGVPTKFVVTNSDEMAHTITAPELGINQTIAAAKGHGQPTVTTFVVTVNKAGKFRWYCLTPCDTAAGGYAMTADKDGPARDGFMAGFFVAS